MSDWTPEGREGFRLAAKGCRQIVSARLMQLKASAAREIARAQREDGPEQYEPKGLNGNRAAQSVCEQIIQDIDNFRPEDLVVARPAGRTR